MSGSFQDTDERNLTRLVVSGVVIGFVLALGLFGIRSLVRSARLQPTATLSVQPATAATTPEPSTAAAQPTVLTATAMPSLTPVLFQFDQMWAAVGNPAPAFTLTTWDGQEVSLSQFKGRPVILNFWASWCAPCAMEMPALQGVFKKYEASGLMVLGINAVEKDDLADIEKFLEENQVTFPILLDGDGSRVSAIYGINGLPASYFIDREGVLRRVQVGAMLPEVADQYAQEILPGGED